MSTSTNFDEPVRSPRSPFDTSGRTVVLNRKYMIFRSWWGVEPWTEWHHRTFYEFIISWCFHFSSSELLLNDMASRKGVSYGWKRMSCMPALRLANEEMENPWRFDLGYGVSVGLFQWWVLLLRERLGLDDERPGGQGILQMPQASRHRSMWSASLLVPRGA